MKRIAFTLVTFALRHIRRRLLLGMERLRSESPHPIPRKTPTMSRRRVARTIALIAALCLGAASRPVAAQMGPVLVSDHFDDVEATKFTRYGFGWNFNGDLEDQFGGYASCQWYFGGGLRTGAFVVPIGLFLKLRNDNAAVRPFVGGGSALGGVYDGVHKWSPTVFVGTFFDVSGKATLHPMLARVEYFAQGRRVAIEIGWLKF